MNKIGASIALAASLSLLAGFAAARPGLATPPKGDLPFAPAPPPAVAAPELAPASVLGAVTLLVGGILVLRGRKEKA